MPVWIILLYPFERRTLHDTEFMTGFGGFSKQLNFFLICHNFLGNPKGPVKLGNPNIYAEVKLYTLEIDCPETEIFYTVSFG